MGVLKKMTFYPSSQRTLAAAEMSGQINETRPEGWLNKTGGVYNRLEKAQTAAFKTSLKIDGKIHEMQVI